MIKSPINVGYAQTAVIVECSTANSLPSLSIVGLASKSVDEAKDRLRSAIAASGYKFPKKKIVINLAPADIPKNTSSLDLAMAVAILSSDKQIKLSSEIDYVLIGELGLDGTIRPAKGIIGMLRSIENSQSARIYIPIENASQVSALANSKNIYPVGSLKEVVENLNGNISLNNVTKKMPSNANNNVDKNYIDFSEIIGQEAAKRALVIAAAGGHNVLLTGPPGTGKSMLAKAFIGLLPDLTTEQSLETTLIHSLHGLELTNLLIRPPLRSPHHTSSNVSLLGGGHSLRPGEISLSHNGILFLDELPEFQKHTIEGLRQPLEDRVISISRAQYSTTYPANFVLVATSNPCPCGYYGSTKPCSCSANEIIRYHKKLSGPILDRIDIHLIVNDVDHKKLLQKTDNQETPLLREKVVLSRRKQNNRTKMLNSNLNNKIIKQHAQLSYAAKEFLDNAAQKLNLSARSYMKTIKVARTIADLEDSNSVEKQHIAEALQYRPKQSNL